MMHITRIGLFRSLSRIAAIAALATVSAAGCDSESSKEPCDIEVFQDHCDGDIYVSCDYYEDKGYFVTKQDCARSAEACAVVGGKTGCWYDYLCSSEGEHENNPKCVIMDLNKPGIYDRVCIKENDVLHWDFQKVEDCDGTCKPGSKECIHLGDECNELGDIGCNGNDIYYCDGTRENDPNSGRIERIKVRHCKADQICAQNDRYTYCADKCVSENEEKMVCVLDTNTQDRRVCSQTSYGLYYIEDPSKLASITQGDEYICVDNDFVPSGMFEECNPQLDTPSCAHNHAKNCRFFESSSEFKWSLFNCGKYDNYYQGHGRCEIINDTAICLHTCQSEGTKRTECVYGYNSYDFDGLNVIEYECRKIDGNLFDYPLSVTPCATSCADETSCAQ